MKLFLTFYTGSKVKHISKKYQDLKSNLQSINTRSAKRHLTKIRGKERRFKADANHCIAKQIVSQCNPNDIIVLENLKNIRKTRLRKPQRKELNKWGFYQLQLFITYKAYSRGISVELVDPKYTSQRCSKCGFTSKSNRKDQTHFECQSCGFRLNADLNASRNIREKYLVTYMELGKAEMSTSPTEFDLKSNSNVPQEEERLELSKPLPLGRGS